MEFKLHLSGPDGAAEILDLTEGAELMLGRGPRMDAQLIDPEQWLSREHLQVVNTDEGPVLKVKGTNGIDVAGTHFGRGESVAVQHGSVVEMGFWVMDVRANIPEDVLASLKGMPAEAEAPPASPPPQPRAVEVISEDPEPEKIGLDDGVDFSALTLEEEDRPRSRSLSWLKRAFSKDREDPDAVGVPAEDPVPVLPRELFEEPDPDPETEAEVSEAPAQEPVEDPDLPPDSESAPDESTAEFEEEAGSDTPEAEVEPQDKPIEWDPRPARPDAPATPRPPPAPPGKGRMLSQLRRDLRGGDGGPPAPASAAEAPVSPSESMQPEPEPDDTPAVGPEAAPISIERHNLHSIRPQGHGFFRAPHQFVTGTEETAELELYPDHAMTEALRTTLTAALIEAGVDEADLPGEGISLFLAPRLVGDPRYVNVTPVGTDQSVGPEDPARFGWILEPLTDGYSLMTLEITAEIEIGGVALRLRVQPLAHSIEIIDPPE